MTADVRTFSEGECRAALPTSDCVYGDYGPLLWHVGDDAVVGKPRPSTARYVRREHNGPVWAREGTDVAADLATSRSTP